MELARAIRPTGNRLKIFHGSKVIEVLPQVGWNKGQCALWIRETLRGTEERLLTLYVGDDWTDEHAFEALARQAITIRVGTAVPASRAEYRLEDVAAVQRFVADLAALAQGRGAA
jgi:trehalose-phosphatase